MHVDPALRLKETRRCPGSEDRPSVRNHGQLHDDHLKSVIRRGSRALLCASLVYSHCIETLHWIS